MSVVLWANRFDAVVDFYAALLSADISDKSDDFARVHSDRAEVLIHRVPDQYAVEIAVPPVLQEENPIKPVFEVADIAGARSAVALSDGQLFGSEREAEYGPWRYCDGFDPDGNVIQVRSAASQ